MKRMLIICIFDKKRLRTEKNYQTYCLSLDAELKAIVFLASHRTFFSPGVETTRLITFPLNIKLEII